MKDFSEKPIDLSSEIASIFSDYSSRISGDKVELLDKTNGDPLYQLGFEKSAYEEELSKLKFHRDYIAVFETSLVFLLSDPALTFSQSELKLTGSIKGRISKEIEQKSLILLSKDLVIDKSKLGESNQFEDLISPGFLACDIDIDAKSLFGEPDSIDLIVNSVIMELSYRCNIGLRFPGYDYLIEKAPVLLPEITTITLGELDPILYFNTADQINYPHLKYLEFYHILEYYFLLARVRKMDELIGKAVSIKLQKKGQLSDPEYYYILSGLVKNYDNDKSSTSELEQLKEIIVNTIGFETLFEILKTMKRAKGKFFLSEQLFSDDKTIVDTSKIIENGKSFRSLDNIDLIDRSKFTSEIAGRIYKIRNYIVHTKKGEKEQVFRPLKEDFDKIENDLIFLRSIVYSAIQIHALRDGIPS